MTQIYWSIPANLLSQSIAIMRPHGVVGNEGLALWFGTVNGARINITHVVDVYGPGFRTTPLYMALSLRAMAALTNLAEQLDAFLVGQIHSHPERLLDLSEIDKAKGIRSPDYLSIVCPYYAQRNLSSFADCGAHVFEKRNYRRMLQDEIPQRLIVCNSVATTIRFKVPA